MRSYSAIILLALISVAFDAGAQGQRRESAKATLDVEWETVEEAIGYEVKLTPKTGGKALQFTTEQSRLTQLLPVGIYQLQIRSREKESGYYGPWSESSDVEVAAKLVTKISPADKTEYEEFKADRRSVTFEWAAVKGAKNYILRIWNDDPEKAQEFTTKKTSRVIGLPIARTFHWQVTFEDESGVRYAPVTEPFAFVIVGSHLETPVVDTNMGHPDVTKASWSTSPKAKSYHARLLTRALDETEWRVISDEKSIEESKMSFARLKPGAYKVEVTAKAPHRRPSAMGSHEFLVKPTEQELQAALSKAL